MNKEEYNTILKLLDDGNKEELKKYLDKRINIKYINSVQKAITNLINSDCSKEYPSYYQRVNLHSGVIKLYKGFYNEIDNGFVICHKRANAFQLYDRSILTPKIINMLEGSYYFNKEEDRISKSQKLINILSSFNESKLKPIFSKCIDEKNIIVWSSDGYELVVPNDYYVIAHKLLGEDTLEYITSTGIYFNSHKGKALVTRKITK